MATNVASLQFDITRTIAGSLMGLAIVLLWLMTINQW
jgi:hypothetical protein